MAKSQLERQIESQMKQAKQIAAKQRREEENGQGSKGKWSIKPLLEIELHLL